MTVVDLNEEELRLVVALRKEAERILQEVPQEQQAQALSDLYAWRNDKIVNRTERNKHG